MKRALSLRPGTDRPAFAIGWSEEGTRQGHGDAQLSDLDQLEDRGSIYRMKGATHTWRVERCGFLQF